MICHRPARSFSLLLLVAALGHGLPAPARAQIAITQFDAPLTENFDQLPIALATPTASRWQDDFTLPGWSATRVEIVASDGRGERHAALQSFGQWGISDRALGGIGLEPSPAPGAGGVAWAVQLINDTGATIDGLEVSFDGEQWRSGAAAQSMAPQVLRFDYRVIDADDGPLLDTTRAGWTARPELDFASPQLPTPEDRALDGNQPAQTRRLDGAVPGPIAPGQRVWLRWTAPDGRYREADGLAIDNLRVTARRALRPTLSILPGARIEGSAGNCPTAPLVVPVLANFAPTTPVRARFGTRLRTFDTAVPNVDYVPVIDGTATIAAGSRRGEALIEVTCDDQTESTELFGVVLNADPSYLTALTDTIASAFLLDDDSQPTIVVDDVRVNEGSPGDANIARFTVRLSRATTRDVDVLVRTVDDTALGADHDYVPQLFIGPDDIWVPLTIPAGETSLDIDVPIVGDDRVEGDEQVLLELTLANGANLATAGGRPVEAVKFGGGYQLALRAIGTIVDDEAEPPALSVDHVTVLEHQPGGAVARFTASLSAAAKTDVRFDIATQDGTATSAEGDYVAARRIGQRIPAGSRDYVFDVPILDDDRAEPEEFFLVTLSAVEGAVQDPRVGLGLIRSEEIYDPPMFANGFE